MSLKGKLVRADGFIYFSEGEVEKSCINCGFEDFKGNCLCYNACDLNFSEWKPKEERSSESEEDETIELGEPDKIKFKKLEFADLVDRPKHYTSVVPGIEAIQVTQHFNFNRGNAIKYLWRAGSKGNSEKEIEDLQKAKKYIEFELKRLKELEK